MATSRDQLIADWRQRLAENDAAETEHPSRAAWLSRLRHRLYHFLLSLYGTGQWNEAIQYPAVEQHDDSPSPPCDDFPKTPQGLKDLGAMRQVLQAVSSAQNNRPAHGTLTSASIRETWLVVASQRQGLDLQKCRDSLLAKNIEAHLVQQGNESVVKVSMIHGHRAATFIALQRGQLLSPEMQQAIAERAAANRSRQAVLDKIAIVVAQSLVVVVLAAIPAAMLTWSISEFNLGSLLPRGWYAELVEMSHSNPNALVIGGCCNLVVMFICLILLRHNRLRKRD